MTKKLTVKYLAMRVAVLEDLIGQLVGNPEVAPNSVLAKEMQAAFGPVMDYGKVTKMISDQQKDIAKKARKAEKKAMQKAQAKAEKLEKSLKKADKKISKMTKTKTPKKGKKYNMPPVNLAPEGHPGHDTL